MHSQGPRRMQTWRFATSDAIWWTNGSEKYYFFEIRERKTYKKLGMVFGIVFVQKTISWSGSARFARAANLRCGTGWRRCRCDFVARTFHKKIKNYPGHILVPTNGPILGVIPDPFRGECRSDFGEYHGRIWGNTTD